MPTPFYHLRMALDLLTQMEPGTEYLEFLNRYAGAFLFGNTAPDVQVVSGQPRQQTHFFNLPIQTGDPPSWEAFLSQYPQLADGENNPLEKTAFLAGYLCHLQADWMWVKEIFAPAFGLQAAWSTFAHRLYLHNALRAYLDSHIMPGLPPGLDDRLCQVRPDGWLPFVDDEHLIQWRQVLGLQLRPGANSQTVEVFSSRQGVSPTEFHALVGSEERMEREVFNHLPLRDVKSYHQRVLEENCRLMTGYLAACGR